MFRKISRFFNNVRHKKLIIAAVLIVGLLFVLAPLLLFVYSTNEGVQDVAEDTIGRQSDPDTSTSDATLLQIAESPSYYYGKTVQVKGQIEEMYSDTVFTITNMETYVDVLVATNEDTKQDQSTRRLYGDNRPIVIQGVLREYEGHEVEQEFGVTIPGTSEESTDTSPVIVADTLRATEEEKLRNLEWLSASRLIATKYVYVTIIFR